MNETGLQLVPADIEFPEDFLVRLSAAEAARVEVLRSQFVTSKERRGGRRYVPYAFTEHGAIMAASGSHLGALPHKCGVPAGFGTPHSCGSGAPKREWPGCESHNENCQD
jgi:hypothetical protein